MMYTVKIGHGYPCVDIQHQDVEELLALLSLLIAAGRSFEVDVVPENVEEADD